MSNSSNAFAPLGVYPGLHDISTDLSDFSELMYVNEDQSSSNGADAAMATEASFDSDFDFVNAVPFCDPASYDPACDLAAYGLATSDSTTCNPAEVMPDNPPSVHDNNIRWDYSLEDCFPLPMTENPFQSIMPTLPPSIPTNDSVSPTDTLSPTLSDRPIYRSRRFALADCFSQLSLGTEHPAAQTASSSPGSAYSQDSPEFSFAGDLSSLDFSPISYRSSDTSPSGSSSPSESSSPSKYRTSRKSRSARSTRIRRANASLRGVERGQLESEEAEKPKSYDCGYVLSDGSVCNTKFARLHDLNRHKRCHTGETNFPCYGCGRSFKRSDARNRHWEAKGGKDKKGGPRCEARNAQAVCNLLATGQLSKCEEDLPILGRRAKKCKEADVPYAKLVSLARRLGVQIKQD